MFNELKKRYDQIALVRKMFINQLFLVLFIILFLTLIISKQTYSSVIENTIENSTQSIKLIMDNLDYKLDDVECMADQIIGNNDMQDYIPSREHLEDSEDYWYDSRLNVLIEAVIDTSDIASGAYVIFDDDRVIFTESILYRNLITDPFYKKNTEKYAKVQGNSGVWLDFRRITYDTTGVLVPTISYRKNVVEGLTGVVAGKVNIDVPVEIIEDSIRNIQFGDTGQIYIAGRNGEALSPESPLQSVDLSEYLSDMNNETDIFNSKIITIEKIDYLLIRGNYNRMDWFIIGVVPMKELLKDQNALIKFIYFVGFMAVIIAAFISYLSSSSISKPIVKKVQEEQKKQREYEFQALQAQIKPHFLYNTLESICALIEFEMNEEALEVANSLAVFYRNTLKNGPYKIALKEEIDLVKKYLIIMKARYKDKFDYEINLPEELYDTPIVRLTIQPIVENALYHGIKNKVGSGIIKISGFRNEEGTTIIVKDDGIGIAKTKLENILVSKSSIKYGSLGVASTHNRLQLLFGEKYGLSYASIEGFGTQVKIKLPSQNQQHLND